jgi:hypothetical protein
VHENGGGNPSDSSEDPAAELVLAPGSPEPARAIEMAYWSEEPGLLEIIRAVACLRPETRTALLAFLSEAPDARRITAAAIQGTLVLSLR